MGKLQVNVLGTTFSVTAAEDDEYLEKLHSYYRDLTKAVKENSGVNDPLKVSILTGITLIDELYKEKQKNLQNSKNVNPQESQKVDETFKEIIQDIDRVL